MYVKNNNKPIIKNIGFKIKVIRDKATKMKIGIKSFLITIIISLYAIYNIGAFAGTASLLPWGVSQFFDNNGNPLSSGKVYFYQVGTSTFKTTWQDSAETIANTNPVTLNAAGRALIYGEGLYRQVVKDKNGNLIWDAVTAPGGGGGGTPTLVGDGNLVGTILPWSGLIAPNQYVFGYGQEILRTTYPEFYTAITQSINVICTAASNTLTGLADTTQINIGSPVELSLCVVPGTTVVSKTASTVVLSNPSSVSLNSVATFFPFGNGNGTTTFNVPDLRGYAIAGRDNMGGTAAGRLTSTYFNTAGLGAVGGLQTVILSTNNLPPYTPTGTLGGSQILANVGVIVGNDLNGGGSSPRGSPVNEVISGSNFTFTGTAQGGTSSPFSIVQPTITINYIVKVTPDTSTSIATGVYSFGGMTGVISCGSGLTCTGNIVSSSTGSISAEALTRTNDTNVTLTLGGGASVSLLSPSSLTLGWTGQLGLTRGGTAASLVASNGGIVYSNATTLAILSGTATANLPLLSGSSTTPSWSTIRYPTAAVSGGIPYFSSTTVMSSSSLLAANQIMIGGGAGAGPATTNYTLNASTDALTVTSTQSFGPVWTVQNSNADANPAFWRFQKSHAGGPAAQYDYMFWIQGQGYDSGSTAREATGYQMQIQAVAAASVDGSHIWRTCSSGTCDQRVYISPAGGLYVGTSALTDAGAGNMQVSGVYKAGAGTGVSATKTVRDSAGTGTCTLIFTGGILTGGTC